MDLVVANHKLILPDREEETSESLAELDAIDAGAYPQLFHF